MFSTIMLTGLPEGNYRHEDVGRLVWPYFSRQNLRSLYYNVTVLTLQRRVRRRSCRLTRAQSLSCLQFDSNISALFSPFLQAFVHFTDWTSCCNFVRDHLKNPVCVGGCELKVHFVLQHMYPESEEVWTLWVHPRFR